MMLLNDLFLLLRVPQHIQSHTSHTHPYSPNVAKNGSSYYWCVLVHRRTYWCILFVIPTQFVCEHSQQDTEKQKQRPLRCELHTCTWHALTHVCSLQKRTSFLPRCSCLLHRFAASAAMNAKLEAQKVSSIFFIYFNFTVVLIGINVDFAMSMELLLFTKVRTAS